MFTPPVLLWGLRILSLAYCPSLPVISQAYILGICSLQGWWSELSKWKPWLRLSPSVVPIIQMTVICSYINKVHLDLFLACLSSPISCPSFPWQFMSQPRWIPCSSWPSPLGAPSRWSALLPSQPTLPTSRTNCVDLLQCLSFPLRLG